MGESLRAGAVRECLEEAGVQVELRGLADVSAAGGGAGRVGFGWVGGWVGWVGGWVRVGGWAWAWAWAWCRGGVNSKRMRLGW